MFDHLLESSHRDDSNKWSDIGCGQETTQVVLIEVIFTQHNWGSEYRPSVIDTCFIEVFLQYV